MQTLSALLESRKQLESEIATHKSRVIEEMKAQMAELGITVEDLGGQVRRGSPAGAKRPVKYRDEAGNTWTGVGQRPRWVRAALLAGRDLESFRVPA